MGAEPFGERGTLGSGSLPAESLGARHVLPVGFIFLLRKMTTLVLFMD